MTSPGATLDNGHRARQAQNAEETRLLVQQLFLRMINPQDIAGTAPRWLNQVITAILRGRQNAWLLASAYATAIRRLDAPDAPAFRMPSPEPVPREKLIRSLMYTGPGKLLVDQRKIPEPTPPGDDPLGQGFVRREALEQYERDLADYEKRIAELPVKVAMFASAAAYRHVTDGGRDAIQTVIRTDSVATGYMRITKEQPCAFCLMLASRGPVYSADSFDRSDPRFEGEGEHKVHDSCGCQLRPIYGSKSAKHWTESARTAEQLWIDEAARYSGADARNAFARAARRAGLADLTRW